MGEYTEIQGQIARIEAVYLAVFNPGASVITYHLTLGRCFDSEAPKIDDRLSYFAAIGELREARPTLAGALYAADAEDIDHDIEP